MLIINLRPSVIICGFFARPSRISGEIEEGGPSDAENRQLFRSVRAEHQDPLDIACSTRTGDE
jgi:hypothetical protein